MSGVDPHGEASHRLSQSQGHRGARASRIFTYLIGGGKKIIKIKEENSNLNYSRNYIAEKNVLCYGFSSWPFLIYFFLNHISIPLCNAG